MQLLMKLKFHFIFFIRFCFFHGQTRIGWEQGRNARDEACGGTKRTSGAAPGNGQRNQQAAVATGGAATGSGSRTAAGGGRKSAAHCRIKISGSACGIPRAIRQNAV